MTAPTNARSCALCAKPLAPRGRGGAAQRFCSLACRRAWDATVRRSGERLLLIAGEIADSIADQAGIVRTARERGRRIRLTRAAIRAWGMHSPIDWTIVDDVAAILDARARRAA